MVWFAFLKWCEHITSQAASRLDYQAWSSLPQPVTSWVKHLKFEGEHQIANGLGSAGEPGSPEWGYRLFGAWLPGLPSSDSRDCSSQLCEDVSVDPKKRWGSKPKDPSPWFCQAGASWPRPLWTMFIPQQRRMLVWRWMSILSFLHSRTDQKEAESTTLYAASTAKRTCPSTSTRTAFDTGSGEGNKCMKRNSDCFLLLCFSILFLVLLDPRVIWPRCCMVVIATTTVHELYHWSLIMLYPWAKKWQSGSFDYSPFHIQ